MLQGLAKDLNWPARPLQASHTTVEGTYWVFISNATPPKDTIEVDGNLVTILQVPDTARDHHPTRLIAPKATTAYLRAQAPAPQGPDLRARGPTAKGRPIGPSSQAHSHASCGCPQGH